MTDPPAAPCPACAAWRETARVLAAEVERQRAMALAVSERLAAASAVLTMLAERKDRRNQP